MWVLRHVEEVPLRNWWSELNPPKLHRLLELLFICVSGFEYRGKSGIRRCIQQRGGRTTEHVKSRLEDLILGQGSARSELILRRRGNSYFCFCHCKYKIFLMYLARKFDVVSYRFFKCQCYYSKRFELDGYTLIVVFFQVVS